MCAFQDNLVSQECVQKESILYLGGGFLRERVGS